MEKPKRILIVRTDRLGDVILSTPVISNLREAFPEAHIAFMCRPYTRDVLAGHPDLDEVIVYDKYGRHKNMFKTLSFARNLIKKNFDWAIILHPTNRAHLVTFLAGIPMRTGWDKKMGYLLTRRIKNTKDLGQKHESQYSLDVLRALDIPIAKTETFFPLTKTARAKVEAILSEHGIKDGDLFITLHPAASCPSKRWPQEYFSQLIGKLMQWGKVAIVTSPQEASLADSVAANPSVIDLRGRLSITQLAWLIKKTALFISNDSGPVHIAGALGTPVISIFGRKNAGLSPQRWKPLGKNSYYIHKDAGCRRCLAHNCTRGFRCLRLVKPEEVYAIAKKILDKFHPEKNNKAFDK